MADTLAPSPQIGWLQDYANKVREALSTYRKVSPVAGYLTTKLLGDAPEGLESMSYGDSPINTRANEPLWNENTAKQLDALSVLPVGAATKAVGPAAKGAHLIPFFLRNAKNIARAEKAKELFANGATPNDVWQATKLFRYPGTPGHLTQAEWGFEVPAGKLTIDPAKLVPGVPVNLAQGFDAPELYHAVPSLRDVEIISDPTADAGGYYAHHLGPAGQVAYAKKVGTPAKNNEVIHHELNHAINAHLSQTQTLGAGINPVQNPIVLQTLSSALRASPGREHLADIIDNLAAPRTLDSKNPAYIENWGRNMGERLAEADRLRHDLPKAILDAESPTEYLNRGHYASEYLKGPLQPSDLTQYAHDATYLDDQTGLEYFLRNLRGKYK
jgi:hypothetical protein